MQREIKFAKNTIILFIGTLCTKIISILLLPFYTGLLTTEQYGTVELLNTIIFLVVPIISLQIDQATFRIMLNNRNNKNNNTKIISTAFIFLMLNIIIYMIIFLLINTFISIQYRYLLCFNILLCTSFTLLLQIARGFGKIMEYTVASFISASITIIMNVILLIVFNMRVEGILLGTLIGSIIGNVFLMYKLNIFEFISFKKFDKKILKELLQYSLPLVPSSISWWIFSVSDRFIVSIMIGLTATGILAVSYKLSSIYIIIYNVFNTSLTESISIHIDDEDIGEYFSNLFEKVIVIFSSLAILILAFMPIIFKMLINSNFNEAYNIIPIAIIASLLQVIVGLTGTVYAAKKNTKAIANTAIVSAIVNLVSDLILIKFIGIYAAVVSTLLSYLIFVIYRYIDVSKKYFKIKYDLKKFVSIIFILIIINLIYYCNGPFIIKVIGMILALLFSYIMNKSLIINCLRFIEKKLKIGGKNNENKIYK